MEMDLNLNKEVKNTVAIIPARGASKRILGKNSRDFCGKPMLAYSIEAALASQLFSEVMVSTDSRQIAQLAVSYGAKVPFMRSEETAGDYATIAEVMMEVLGEYEKRGRTFDVFACIYATAPFVTAEKLRMAMDLLQKEDCYGVLPVVRFSFPPQRAYEITEGNELRYLWEAHSESRSQDLEPLYHDAGQFSFYRVQKYMQDHGKVREKIAPFVLSEMEVQDIDEECDWQMAKLKYQFMQQITRQQCGKETR